MPKSSYLPNDAPVECACFSNFAKKLPGYAAAFNFVGPEVSSVAADNAFFAWVCDAKNQYSTKSQDWTAYKNILRGGPAPLGAIPSAPSLGTPPALAPPNIFGRITALVARLKTQPGYTQAIGEDLGIVGAEETVDLDALKPILTLPAGHPNVGWIKQGMDGLEIWVDRGTGFAFLAHDTVPDYLDTAPLPAPGTSAVWKYKAIYRLRDEQVGHWSDVASVSVMG